jgi:hypothetical protein
MSSCRFQVLSRFLEGKTGPHIEKAVQQLSLPAQSPDNRPGIQEYRASRQGTNSHLQVPVLILAIHWQVPW